jgi:hypothetical protein
MPLQSSGLITFDDLRTEYSLTGTIGLDMLRGWSGVPAFNMLSLGDFYGRTYQLREYPPTTIGTGGTWIKDSNDVLQGLDRIYRKYKFTIPTSTYGQGQYVASANTILFYFDGSAYSNDEWPPSGAFDKQLASSTRKAGWHVSVANLSSAVDAAAPPIITLQLPFPIAVRRYSMQCRSDCCNTQLPSKWNLEASNEGSVWTVVDSRSGVTQWTLSETKTWDVSNTRKYSYYRLVAYRTAGSTMMHISEIVFFAPEYM